ncbi:hypothetical protein C9J85_19270 [Haloferax sp. wsp5]|nr:hypothetical protein C9J85_19270 [Haloferax sp. wsp5]
MKNYFLQQALSNDRSRSRRGRGSGGGPVGQSVGRDGPSAETVRGPAARTVMQHKLDVLECHCEGYGRPFGEATETNVITASTPDPSI